MGVVGSSAAGDLSPLWPFTHRNVTSSDFTSSINGIHRSVLATGSRFEFFQPLRSHLAHQRSRKQFTTYVESDTISIGIGAPCSSARAA
jgi:hypothetical protein